MQIVIDGIIYQRQSHGGISRIYNELLPRLCKLDPTVFISLLTSRECLQTLPQHPQIVHKKLLPVDGFFRPVWLWGRLASHVRSSVYKWSLKNDINNIWHSTYYTSVNQWKGPKVVTVLDLVEERLVDLFSNPQSRYIKQQKKNSIENADAILCISDLTCKDVQEIYNVHPGKLHVVPLAASDIFRIVDTVNIPSNFEWLNRPFFLYIGGRSAYKNFDGLLTAYAAWRLRSEIDLLVVGAPWSSGEREKLSALGIVDNVRRIGFVDDETLCWLYNQAAAFIYPSLYEGFGIPLLEAMACGCPVIASNIPTTKEIAGAYPIYFELSELQSLCDAMEQVISEDGRETRLALAEIIVKRYSWDKTAQQTLDVYRTVASS